MLVKLAVMAGAWCATSLLGMWRGACVLRRSPAVSLDLVHRELPETWPLLAFCVTSTVAAICLFTRPALLWLVPAMLDPWSLPLLFCCSTGPFAYLFTVSLPVAKRANAATHRKLVLAGIILLLALCPIYALYSRPIYRSLGDVRTPDGAVLQTSPFSCVPAAAASALAALGIDSSEREVARLAGTTILGTSPGELITSLRKKGVCAHKAILSVDALRRADSPIVLLVDYPGLGPLSHAIMFERMERDEAMVIDPLNGRAALKLATLEQQWHGHAICLSHKRQ